MADPLSSPRTVFGGTTSTTPQQPSVYDLTDPFKARALMSPARYSSGSSSVPVYTPPSSGSTGSSTSPFEDVGKTSFGFGMVPGSRLPGEVEQPVYQPPPGSQVQMTGLEALGRQLMTQITGVLPPDIQKVLVDGAGAFASFASIPFNIAANAAPIPTPSGTPIYGSDTKGVFSMMPESDEKQQAERAAEADPVHALYYMSEYLQMHELELAHVLGVSPLVADFYVPTNNFGDQIMRTFGALGLGSRIIARLWTNMEGRHIESSILAVPDEQLDPNIGQPGHTPSKLVELKHLYLDGQITDTELKDMLAREGYGWTNDPLMDMAYEMLFDPLNIAFMAGAAAKGLSTLPVLARASRAVGLARDAAEAGRIPAEVVGHMDAYALARFTERLGGKVVPDPVEMAGMLKNTDRMEYLNNNGYRNFMEEATKSLTPRQQVGLQLEPYIRAAASVSEAINWPFGLPGKAIRGARGQLRAGQRIAAFSSRESVIGLINAYGGEKYLALVNEAKSVGDDAVRALENATGRTGANVEAVVHGDVLSRAALNQGAVPKWMPDPIVRAMSEVYHTKLSQMVEGYVRRIKTQFLPSSHLSKEGLADEMVKQRALAVEKLKSILGPRANEAQLTKFIAKSDDEMLALVEHLYYGHSIGTFIEAKTAGLQREIGERTAALTAAEAAAKKAGAGEKEATALEKAKAALAEANDWIKRLTIIGPRTLTRQRAGKVLSDAKNGNISAVRDAIEKYDQLYTNFAGRGLSDKDTLQEVRNFLEDVLDQKGQPLVISISRDKLPVELQTWFDAEDAIGRPVGREGYIVGLAPDEASRWRVTRDASGKITGVTSWITAIEEKAAVPGISRVGVIRDKLFRPIRGERILEQARRDFRKIGVREYGLTPSESNALFSAVRKAAEEAQTMPRGLTSGQLSELADQMGLDAATRARLGTRGLAKLVAQAFEGDAMTVGITQKISGRAKRIGADKWGGNWLGFMAERIYPSLRFTYNPIFLAQEAIEPFFWNIIKGVKPGIIWRRQDVEALESLRVSGFLGEWADQYEYSASALLLAGQKEASRVAGPNSMIGNLYNRWIGEGKRIETLAEMKRLNYIRSMNRDYGRSLKKMYDELSPATWEELAAHVGTDDPSRIANYFWMNKGLFAPDDPMTQAFLMDMAKPDWVAAHAAIHVDSLARVFAFSDGDALRQAVKDTVMTEDEFTRVLTDVAKADPGYISRAWYVLNAASPEEHWKALENALVDSGTKRAVAREYIRATRAVVSEVLRAGRRTEDEYFATKFYQVPKYVSSKGDLPNTHLFHIASHPEEFFGQELGTRQIEAVQRIGDRAVQLTDTLSPGQAAIPLTALSLTHQPPAIEGAAGQGVMEGLARPVKPPEGIINITKGPEGEVVFKFGGDNSPEDAIEIAVNNLGEQGSENVIEGYSRLVGGFKIIADGIPDEHVWRLVEDAMVLPFEARVTHLATRRVAQMKADDVMADLRYLDDTPLEGFFRDPNAEPDDGLFSAVYNDFIENDIPVTGKPESGVMFVHGEDIIGTRIGTPTVPVRAPKRTTYGWYGPDGDLVTGATISEQLVSPEEIKVAGGPMDPGWVKARQTTKNMPPEEAMGIGEMPPISESYVSFVATRGDYMKQGYYQKLTDFIDSKGEHLWADLTGRSAYTEAGYRTAKAWLARKSKEDLRLAREEIAARLVTSYAALLVQSDVDEAKAIKTVLNLLDTLTNERRFNELRGGIRGSGWGWQGDMLTNQAPRAGGRAGSPAIDARRGVQDASTLATYLLHPDVWEKAVGYPNWRLTKMVEYLTGTGDMTSIPPTLRMAEAMGYPTERTLTNLVRRQRFVIGDNDGAARVAVEPRQHDVFLDSWAERLGVARREPLTRPETPLSHEPGIRDLPPEELRSALNPENFRAEVQRLMDIWQGDAGDVPLGDWLERLYEHVGDLAQRELYESRNEMLFLEKKLRIERLRLMVAARTGLIPQDDGLAILAYNLKHLTPDRMSAAIDTLYTNEMTTAGTRALFSTDLPEGISIDVIRREFHDDMSILEDEMKIAPARERAYQRLLSETGRTPTIERVTPEMYAYMSKNNAEVAAHFNAIKWLNRTDWTAGKVASLRMASYRETFRSGVGQDGSALLRRQTFEFSTDSNPWGMGMMREPSATFAASTNDEALVREFENGMPMVNRDLLKDWMEPLGDLTGLNVVGLDFGPTVDAIRGPWQMSSERGAGGTFTVLGTREQVEKGVALTAATLERPSVWAYSLDDIRELMGGEFPVTSRVDLHQSSIGPTMDIWGSRGLWGMTPTTDLILDGNVSRADIERLGDYIERTMFGDVYSTNLPPVPGATPVPEGYIRVYHYTQALPEVLETGLSSAKARGHTYGEPDMIWVSAAMPDPDTQDFVEFWVKPEELERNGPWPNQPWTQEQIDRFMERGSNATLVADYVPPQRFITFNTPENSVLRQLNERYAASIPLSGDDIDSLNSTAEAFLRRDPEHPYAKAIQRFMAERQATSTGRLAPWRTAAQAAEQRGYHVIRLPDGRQALRIPHTLPGLGPLEGDIVHMRGISEAAMEENFPIGDVQRELLESGRWGGPAITIDRKITASYHHEPIAPLDIAQETLPERHARAMSNIDDTSSLRLQRGGDLREEAVVGPAFTGEDYPGRTFIRLDEPNWQRFKSWWAETSIDPWINDIYERYPEFVQPLRDYYRPHFMGKKALLYQQHTPGNWYRLHAGNELRSAAQQGYLYHRIRGLGIVGATDRRAADAKAAIFLLKGAKPETVLHEFFHQFAGEMDDSMIVAIHEAYAKAKGLTRHRVPQVGGRPQLTRAVEEWAAEEFTRYSATGVTDDAAVQSAFNLFGRAMRKAYGKTMAEVAPDTAAVFDKMFSHADAATTAVPFNPDEWRLWGAARYGLLAEEDAAHTVHYFRRGRSMVERSINHPYLGYYPASYMWGKVVPEFMKFLLLEPFGIKAPLWGLSQASHVWQGIQLQLHTDQDFRDFIDGHPELLRFAEMMLPGTPWDIPVNAPAWARHLTQYTLDNVAREQQGKDPLNVDLLTEAQDTAQYAFGAWRFLGEASRLGQEWHDYNAAQQEDINGAAATLRPLLHAAPRTIP